MVSPTCMYAHTYCLGFSTLTPCCVCTRYGPDTKRNAQPFPRNRVNRRRGTDARRGIGPKFSKSLEAGDGDEKECLTSIVLGSIARLHSTRIRSQPNYAGGWLRRGQLCTCSAPRLRPMREMKPLRLSSAQPVQTSQSHAFTPSRPHASSTSSRSVRRPPGTASKPLANPPVWRRAASARIGGSRA